MRGLINKFRVYQEKLNKSNNTINSYVKEIERFIKQYNIETIEDLKILQDKNFVMETWLADITEKYAPRTTNRIKASLSIFVAFLITEDILEINRFKLIEDIVVDTKKIKTYTREEEDKMLKWLNKKIEEDNFKRHIDKQVFQMQNCIIKLLMSSGMRISEIVKMRIEDINLETRTFNIRGKSFGGNVSRINKFKIDMMNDLKKYLEIRSNITLKDELDEIYLFISPLTKKHITENTVRKFVQNTMFKELGMNGTLHEFRHTRATQLLEANKDIKAISKFLGHSSTKVTESVYLHETEEMMDDLANI